MRTSLLPSSAMKTFPKMSACASSGAAICAEEAGTLF